MGGGAGRGGPRSLGARSCAPLGGIWKKRARKTLPSSRWKGPCACAMTPLSSPLHHARRAADGPTSASSARRQSLSLLTLITAKSTGVLRARAWHAQRCSAHRGERAHPEGRIRW
jgi:hypothetical protein